jgi:quercetin dioxygenase-like cupin family protein
MTTASQPPPSKAIWFLENLLLFHITGEETGGALDLIEFYGPSGEQPPPHVHRAQDEGFYVIEGEITIFLPDKEIVLAPGDFFSAPKGVPHVYRVTSPDTARFLVTAAPAGVAAFMEEYGSPAESRTLPKPEPPDVDRLISLAAKYDVEIVGPPGAMPKDLPAS